MTARILHRVLRLVLVLSLLCLYPQPVSSQETSPNPRLVADINTTGSYGSQPSNFMEGGSAAYFFARWDFIRSDSTNGRWGLWKTDGTPPGTLFLQEVLPPSGKSTQNAYQPNFLFLDGVLYFAASRPETGMELWRTDGTPQGTALLADLAPGAASSYPRSFAELNGALYFVANDQLYHSDGTASGTAPAFAGTTVQVDSALLEMNGGLYFTGRDAQAGWELWSTDGTLAGTQRVCDLAPGAASSSTVPLLAYGGKLFFSATDLTHGKELWSVTGPLSTPALLADANPTGDGLPQGLVALNDLGLLFFSAVNPAHGRELWASDGTPGGTHLVKDLNPGTPSGWPVMLGSVGEGASAVMLFTARDSTTGDSLWRTDGSESGTVKISPAQPRGYITPPDLKTVSPSTLYGGARYFSAVEGTYGWELWRSDGTPQGTGVALDLIPGMGSSYPSDPVRCGTRLCFGGNDGLHGREPWSIGSSAPTDAVLLADLNAENWDSTPGNYTALKGNVFFTAEDAEHGRELWATSGSADGAYLVKDINPGKIWSWPHELTVLGEALYFTANDGQAGTELWRSNGTPDGTVLLKDIFPGQESSDPYELTSASGRLFFIANAASRDPELWVSDGTAGGTRLVSDLSAGGSGSPPHGLTAYGSRVLLWKDVWDNQNELWISDGTTAGTARLGVFRVRSRLTAANGLMYFTALGPDESKILYQTNGTASGTRPVALPAGLEQVANIQAMAALDGALYLTDFNHQALRLIRVTGNGAELLWSKPGPFAYYPLPLLDAFGSRLALQFADSQGRFTFWVYDTLTGQASQLPGDYQDPGSATPAAALLFFNASDAAHGRELWYTDGTQATRISDIRPGPGSSFRMTFEPMAFFGSRLYFDATDGVHGEEPWVYTLDLPNQVYLPALSNSAHPAPGCQVIFQDPSDGAGKSKGSAFDVHWTLKNTSASAWRADSTEIRFMSGDHMHTGNDIRDVPYDVAPGGTLDLTISMVAPSTAGTYVSNWVLSRGVLPLCSFYVQIRAN